MPITPPTDAQHPPLARGAADLVPELLDDPYPQLLALAQYAFRSEQYALAYHALAAALHSIEASDQANQADQLERFAEVQRLAAAWLHWLDTYHADDPIASRAASARRSKSVFAALTSQAHAQAATARQRQALLAMQAQEHRGRQWHSTADMSSTQPGQRGQATQPDEPEPPSA